MNRSPLIRIPLLALLGASTLSLATPSVAAPPVVAPTLPTPAQPAPTSPAPGMVQAIPAAPLPAPIPPLSAAQEAWANDWLKQGAAQGLMARQKASGPLSGEALVRAVLDRAKALSTGRVDTADFLEVWALRPAPFDPRPSLARAVAEDRLAQWANSLTPPYAGYDGLRKGLVRYEAIRDRGGWPTLTAQSAPDVVRARIAIEDSAVTPGEKLSDVLQRAQRRYGLNPTGLLDTRTLAALNVSVDDRIAAIMANMEPVSYTHLTLPTICSV